jgi:hypothetical protein
MFRKLNLFPSSDEGRETPTLLGSLERGNLSHPLHSTVVNKLKTLSSSIFKRAVDLRFPMKAVRSFTRQETASFSIRLLQDGNSDSRCDLNIPRPPAYDVTTLSSAITRVRSEMANFI